MLVDGDGFATILVPIVVQSKTVYVGHILTRSISWWGETLRTKSLSQLESMPTKMGL